MKLMIAGFWAFVQRDEPPRTGRSGCGTFLAPIRTMPAARSISPRVGATQNTLFRELLDFKRQRERLEFVESATARRSGRDGPRRAPRSLAGVFNGAQPLKQNEITVAPSKLLTKRTRPPANERQHV